MNYGNVKWAAMHDWFVETIVMSSNTYAVVVRDDMGGSDLVFTNFSNLREWAGY